MSKFIRTIVLASMLTVFATAPAIASSDSKITIVNKSSWAIHEFYLSRVDEAEWGEDQLGKRTIETGEQFTLTGIPCDSWDVKVVDEDGDICQVDGVNLCADKDRWVINDTDLIDCQAGSE